MYELLAGFQERDGHCTIPYGQQEDGNKLGHWVIRQMRNANKGKLGSERIQRLENIGFVLSEETDVSLSEKQWNSMYELLAQLKNERGIALFRSDNSRMAKILENGCTSRCGMQKRKVRQRTDATPGKYRVCFVRRY